MASKRATPSSDAERGEVDAALEAFEMAQDIAAYREAKAADDGSRVSLSALRLAGEVVEQYADTMRRLEDA